MDPNGTGFLMLAEEAQWHLFEEPSRLRWDAGRRSLRLASQRALPAPVTEEPEVTDEARLARVPQTVDPFGSRAYYEPGAGRVRVRSDDLPEAIAAYQPPPGDEVTDLALGSDGVLYLAVSGRLVMEDRRDRWDPAEVAAEGLVAWRLAPLPEGGVWVLDRDGAGLARIQGQPLPRRPPVPYASTTWRPCEENPDPPAVKLQRALELEGGETAVALAASPEGRLALLTRDAGGAGRLRLVGAGGCAGPARELLRAGAQALRLPFSLAWLDRHRVAVMVPGLRETPVYDLDVTGSRLLPGGGLHPLRDHDGGPFAHTAGEPPHYPTAPGHTLPLHRLSLPSFSSRGRAASAWPLDSGHEGTVWHRLYLEAAIPSLCAIRVDLATSEVPAAPLAGDAWQAHVFGSEDCHPGAAGDPAAGDPAAGDPAAGDPAAGDPVRGVWVSRPSELPFHPGLLACPREQQRAGLFTALIQRRGRRVSALVGRYLWVRLELAGDGMTSPELAALRAWAGRFSYVDRYLPELYHEQVFGAGADAPGPATGADFLERFLGNFEGFLTPLEDRVAHADLLTDPGAAPAGALEWLAGWIGLRLEPGMGERCRRALLQAAPELYRRRGTLPGLELALDLATSGAVSGGEVIVLEDFRLRRTFATILGADLEAEDDPLLPGLIASGNSFLGDTLILGREERRELLSLFRSELDPGTDDAEADAVAGLSESLANRVTVLVHRAVEPQDLKLVRRMVELEAPAHVAVRVVAVSHDLLAGLSALVGVDTYLAERPAPRAVELGRSRLGGDRLMRAPGLDPRLGGSDPLDLPPTADAGADRTAELGDAVILDGTGSRAAAGRSLVRYQWTLIRSTSGN